MSRIGQRLRSAISLGILVVVLWPSVALATGLRLLLELVRFARWLPRVHAMLGVDGRILYFEPSPADGSGYEYRIRHWAARLEREGFTTRTKFALSRRETDALLGGGWAGLFFAHYVLRRLAQVLQAPFCNVVVVRRELLVFNDYGGLFLERLLLALNPRVILDFDDDIAASKREPREIAAVGRLLGESGTKFGDSLSLYPAFIAGSRHLAEQVPRSRRPEPAVTVIPTCVNVGDLPAKNYDELPDRLTLGWIGTNGNLPQLERIVPALDAVAREIPLRLIVIAGRDLEVSATFPVENRRWSLDSQVGDLLEVDIGLMPLVDTVRERGKCGFKLLQYMALGIVGVATGLTTNTEIVTDGRDGFLVAPDASWAVALRRVVTERHRFGEIGGAARQTVADRYSFDANAATYLACISSRRATVERPGSLMGD